MSELPVGLVTLASEVAGAAVVLPRLQLYLSSLKQQLLLAQEFSLAADAGVACVTLAEAVAQLQLFMERLDTKMEGP